MARIELDQLDGDNGVAILTPYAGDTLGRSVSGIGDINGDGIDDVLIGASSRYSNGQSVAGGAYVPFGSTDGFAAFIGAESLDGDDGFIIAGVNADQARGIVVDMTIWVGLSGADSLAAGDFVL